jgi:hypothetical protein
LTGVLAGSPALAQDPAHDRAVAAFEEARRFIAAGDCASAVVRLAQSLQLEPSVGANLSLADCYETSDPLLAWTKLREAERLAYLKHDDRRAVARERATALEPKLPVVRIEIPPSTLLQPELELRVDGVRIDPYFYGDTAFAMAAGPHVLAASLPHRSWSRRVVAEIGATTPVAVDLDECPATDGRALAPPQPARAPSAAQDPGSTRRSLAYVVGGVGVAALGAGTLFGVVSLTKKADIESACGGNASACSAHPGILDAEQADQRTFGRLSSLSFAFAGAAITGAVVLYLTAPHNPEGRIEVAPVADGHGSGVMMRGAW